MLAPVLCVFQQICFCDVGSACARTKLGTCAAGAVRAGGPVTAQHKADDTSFFAWFMIQTRGWALMWLVDDRHCVGLRRPVELDRAG